MPHNCHYLPELQQPIVYRLLKATLLFVWVLWFVTRYVVQWTHTTLAKQSRMHLCRVFFSGLKPYTNVHVVRVPSHTPIQTPLLIQPLFLLLIWQCSQYKINALKQMTIQWLNSYQFLPELTNSHCEWARECLNVYCFVIIPMILGT